MGEYFTTQKKIFLWCLKSRSIASVSSLYFIMIKIIQAPEKYFVLVAIYIFLNYILNVQRYLDLVSVLRDQ